jgi:elongator complex protein 3
MDIHKELKRRGTKCACVRCREVRGRKVDEETLQYNELIYQADGAEEHFLSFVTPKDRLAGFLRLSLPGADSPETGLEELEGAAIIREVHVYGQSLEVGDSKDGAAQHIGLGTQLLEKAEEIARGRGYQKLVVISAIGTREYYAGRGFTLGQLYMTKLLKE